MTSAGYLHPRLLSWDGADVLRFVAPDTGSREEPQMGPVALGADSGLWIAKEGRYEIVLLGTDGTVARRITRNAEWFPDGVRPAGMPWVKRPAPYIAAISPGPDHLLWVLVRRAHRHWEENKSKTGAISGPPTPRSLSTISPDQIFEGVLEVFDMTTGAFLASREVGGGVLGFVNPRVLYEVIELDSGETRIQLWNFSLSR